MPRLEEFNFLVVDDSPTMRRIIVNTLRRAMDICTDIQEAAEGQEALEKIQTTTIDFVITDWDMPNMDGGALISAIRDSKEFGKLPVLVVTTKNKEGVVVAAMKAGASGYICKPFMPEDLLKQIKLCVKTR